MTTKMFLPAAAGVVVLVFCGVVHGLWTDRWVGQEELDAALEKLQALPADIGDWQGEDLKPAQLQPRQAMASLSRRYVHRRTGQSVTLFLAGGRPGPVSIHTPDVCYAASGWTVGRESSYSVPAAKGQPQAELFTAQLTRTRAAEQTRLRIFWGWYAGGRWVVADNPRFAFSGEPRLFKMYLINEMVGSKAEPLERDPCVSFLPELLPVLERSLSRS